MQCIDIFVKRLDDRCMRLLLALVIPSLLAIALITVSVYRTRTDSDRFLRSRHLPITAATRELAKRFLDRDAWFRRFGAWVALFLVIGWYRTAGIHQNDPVAQIGFALVLAGSSLGVVWAARRPRRQRGTERSASIRPRAVDDFLPPWARRRELELATFAVAIAAIAAGFARQRDMTIRMAICAAFAITVPLAIRRLQRRVLELAQPAAASDLVLVDDAHRASTVQALHHAGIGLLCCVGIIACASMALVGQTIEARDGTRVVSRVELGATGSLSVVDRQVYLRTTTDDGRIHLRQIGTEPASANTSTEAVDTGLHLVRPYTWLGLANLIAVVLSIKVLIEWTRIRTAPFQPLTTTIGTERSARASIPSA